MFRRDLKHMAAEQIATARALKYFFRQIKKKLQRNKKIYDRAKNIYFEANVEFMQRKRHWV